MMTKILRNKALLNIRIIIFFLFFLIHSCVRIIYHDPEKAVDACNIFLKAVIKEDYETAYGYISNSLKKDLTFEKFEINLKNSRKYRGVFSKAVFDSYLPVPAKRAIQLYYYVDHKDAGDVLYHFVLEGDKEIGYKIGFVDIGNQVKSPSKMKYINSPERVKLDREIIVTGD